MSVGAALLALACATDDRGRSASVGGGTRPDAGGGAVDPCATPAAGCPCAEANEVIECGQIYRRSSEYVSCSMGKRECQEDLTWGECRGDRIANVPTSNTRPFALGTSGDCTDNPCDPYCQWVVDEPDGLDTGDAGVVTSDGGLQLTEVPVAVANGKACTGLSIAPANHTFTVTSISPGVTRILGQYFNQRSSSIPSSWTATGTRRDAVIDFDWATAAPGVSGVAADNFSVRWTGYVVAPTTESYTFYTRSGDGARLWVNGQLVIDKWIDQGPTEHASAPITLSKGQPVSFKLEFYERTGSASVRLSWSSASVPKQVIPESSLTSNPSLAPFTVSPETAQFTVAVSPADCYDGEIPAAFTLNRLDVATVDATGTVSLFSPVAGPIQVRAYVGQFSATGNVNVVVNSRDVSNAPTGTANVFTGAGSGTDPMKVLYPYSGTVFPLGIKPPVIQWDRGGTTASAVKIGLRYPANGAAAFLWETIVEETSPPRYTVPAAVWKYFSQTAKGQDAAYTVQRYIAGSLRPVVVRPIRFGTAPLRGKIYYTEYGRSDHHAYIMGADPGSDEPARSVFSTASETSGNKCPVCHSVSANGQMFVTSDRSWSSNGGVAKIDSAGLFSRLSDFPSDTSYRSGAEDWRGFAWAPLTPDGAFALAANNIWGNSRQSVVGIDTATRAVNVPIRFLSTGRGTGLYAEYFNSNNLTGTAYTRIDSRINYDWGNGSPVSAVAADNFSVRWSGEIQPYATEIVTFEIQSSDGVRLYVNGQTVIDAWAYSGSTTTRTGTIALDQGSRVPIRLEHRDSSGAALVRLRWRGEITPNELVPSSQLYATQGGTGLFVTYYDNQDFTGPALSRVEPDVYANWGAVGPDPSFGADSWSSVWEGQLHIPRAGAWRLCVNAADTFKLISNGVTILSSNTAGDYCTGDLTLAAQMYALRIEHSDASGNANLQLDWRFGTVIPRERIPQTQFYLPSSYTTPTNGVTATYYATSDFGASSTATTPIALSRIEATVNANWGTARPNYSILTSSDGWSSRYTGSLRPSCDGVHEFELESDEAAALYIDEQRVTYQSTAATTRGALYLISGQFYDLKADGVDATGSAKLIVRWKPSCNGATSFTSIPSANLFPSGDKAAAGMVRAGGDNGAGFAYRAWRMPNASGVNPTDVTDLTRGNWGLGNSVMMVPSFAPDASKLVFVDGDSGGGAGWRKGLSVFSFDQSRRLFYGRRLVYSTWPFGDVLKWPIFESDSRTVIFQTSTPTEFCCRGSWTKYGHMAPTNYYEEPGLLWSVDTDSASSPVELQRLNRGERDVDANKAYQVTSLPVAAAGYRWAVFTSTRPYGNTVNVSNQNSYLDPGAFTPMLNYTEIQSQLWVSAIDDTPSATSDRSHPAFWLPNQNYNESSSQGFINERAFWVLDPCKPAGTTKTSECEVDEDCCGGNAAPKTAVCRIDTPVSVPPTRHCAAVADPGSCRLPGDSCTGDSDCCAGTVCLATECAKPPDLSLYSPANYERIYQAECPAGTQATWRFFDFKGKTPDDSALEFYVESTRKPESASVLPLAPLAVTTPAVVALGTISGPTVEEWQGFDIGKALKDADLYSWDYIKITVRLMPNTKRTRTPVLIGWRQSYSCPPAE